MTNRESMLKTIGAIVALGLLPFALSWAMSLAGVR